ncbi:tRNA lysidine(34) synthetase TilS [Geobacter sp. FeAm09]|uniref:tRNA lysidine(34) synthetase TilS n=1 Tax=Geobacter sp. FeAm09 TaxID=2597769 RepID=UPI0011EBD11E|nr:tRNA lysidine(34) synthetase TilS [Geobacter sp. FeAm09]QEM68085.1 tRNA lysidine(34) synthetase TilS [Geobacter sp. FeAm09]
MTDITMTLPLRVARTIREHGLFAPGDTVIVALSGGADSTALLDLLSRLPGCAPRLVAAHLNHCLRGPESDRDEEFVRTLAARYRIPLECRRVDVNTYAQTERLNLEDAGRQARIAFLDELRHSWQAAAVALAHHADDQAETVLMRLLRGAGPGGLSGMSYRNGRSFIRPLLEFSRDELVAYLTARGLTWHEDASNLDTTFLRNRIRHELLPLLESYNPAIRERLAATAAVLSDEHAFLDRLAHQVVDQSCTQDGGTLACHLPTVAGQPPALRRRVFRLLLERLAGNLKHFSNRHIAALEHLLESSRPNAALNLPQGIAAVREYDTLLVRRTTEPPSPPAEAELEITDVGHYRLPGGAHLTLTLVAAPAAVEPLPAATALFDPDRAPFPWHVRMFRPGDRLAPYGMAGNKKVKELFINAKVPPSRRCIIPLLFSGDTLLWVCGLRTSRLASLDGTSTRAIRAVFSET